VTVTVKYTVGLKEHATLFLIITKCSLVDFYTFYTNVNMNEYFLEELQKLQLHLNCVCNYVTKLKTT